MKTFLTVSYSQILTTDPSREISAPLSYQKKKEKVQERALRLLSCGNYNNLLLKVE